MPTLAKNEGRHLDTGMLNISSSSVYTQPWWRGFESNSVPSSHETLNGSVTAKDVPSQGDGEEGTKESNTSVDHQSGMDSCFLCGNAIICLVCNIF